MIYFKIKIHLQGWDNNYHNDGNQEISIFLNAYEI